MAEQGSSTKQLVPTLGFGDLMGAAVGQIIGAGIMSLMPAAIENTGRSVFLSFLVAAVLTCCTAIPAIFITSVVKLRGGIYTQLHMVGGDLAAGMYVIIYVMSNMSISMYGLSLASYLTDLFQIDASYDKWIALVILTAFLILNLIGLDVFAKVQNLLVIILIGSLIMFGVAGFGKVSWGTYFQPDEYWMPNGVMGMLESGGLLVFDVNTPAKLAALDGVTATIKGAQTAAPVVWLTGEADAHKDEIEKLGGKWSGKRSAWYFKIA